MYKVIIAEDEPRIREAIAQYLPWQDWGYEVSGTAGNGQDALDQIRINRPDVVLADIRMPLMDGLTLVREIKKTDPSIIAVILSGHDDFEYARQAMALGAFAYLLKTEIRTKLGEVMRQVRTLLDENAQEAANRQKAEKALFCQAIIKTLLNQNPGEAAETLRLSLDQCQYYLVLVRLFDENEKKATESGGLPVSELQGYLEHRLSGVACPFVVLSIKPAELVFLFYDQQITETAIAQLQARLNHITIDMVRQPFAQMIKLVVVSTQIVDGSSQLFTLYRQAGHKALVYLPGSQVALLQTQEADINMPDQLMTQAFNLETQFFDAIQVTDDAQALQLLDQWIHLWTNATPIQVPVFRQRCTWLIIELQRLVKAVDPSSADHDDNILGDMQNPNALSNWLRIQITRLLSSRQAIHADMAARVASIRQYVKDHCLEKINLQEIADRMHVNASYLSTCYKKETGLSFSEYYTSLRMEKAAELLSKGRTVASVSALLGYADTKSFRQTFRKYHGKSPGEITGNRPEIKPEQDPD